jgi:hypothetical protein
MAGSRGDTPLLRVAAVLYRRVPRDNPRTILLAEVARLVSIRRRMVFRSLPEAIRPDGTVSRPLVMGLPMAPIFTGALVPPFRIELVLFAVVNPAKAQG